MAEEDAVSITPIELSETRCFVAIENSWDYFLQYFDFDFHFLGI